MLNTEMRANCRCEDKSCQKILHDILISMTIELHQFMSSSEILLLIVTLIFQQNFIGMKEVANICFL